MNPVYRFYSKSSTGATIKLTYNKADADAIKAGINNYISAAKAMGYTDEQSFLGTITLSKPVIDSKNSSIKITDPSSIVSGSEGTAKFDLAHQLYRVHDPRTNYSVPLSITANANIASYHFEDKNHQTITNFTDYFGGMFYLVATPVEGQVITSLSMKGDSSCEFYFALDEQSEVIPNTFVVYPSNLELNEFEITIVTTPESEVATEQTVTIGQHGNASVKINGTNNDSATFMSGSTVAFTVTCPTLYQLDSVKVVDSNSQELAVTKTGEEGTKTFYSFTMPKDDVTIVVQTSEKAVQKYSYSAATNLTGGTINLESGQAKKGETVSFTVSPSSGYEMTSIFVVGDSSITISENPLHPGTYQFTMPEKDVVVSATFAQISVKHNITKPSELEEGRVLLKSESTAAAGETVSFTIEAYEGYEIESYGIENHPEITIAVTPPGFMQKLNTYSFTMPDFDVNIQVTFKSIPKELTKITVSGAKTTFTVGDDFATTGLVVTASFNYGNDEDVTANAVVDSAAVNMSVAGEYNVVVSYQGKTTSYSIKVENAESGGQEVSSVKYSVTTSGAFARELTIVLNSDGTGVFTNKKVSNNTTSTFYFIWTLDNGIYTVSPDTTKTSSNFVTGSASNIYNTTDCLTNTFTINNNQLTISLVWSDYGTPVSYTFSLVD